MNKRYESYSSYGNDPLYRWAYDEEDVSALICNPALLIAVDAYGKGNGTLTNVLQLGFTGPPYVFRNLHPLVFAELAVEVVDRIHSENILVPTLWKERHSSFYTMVHTWKES